MNLNQFNGFAKLGYHKEWLQAYLRGESVAPICIEIDLTNACNYNCPNCAWRNYNSSNRTMVEREMAVDQLRQCVEVGIKAVIFSGGGEPLLSPFVMECIKLAWEMGLSVGLFTNGLPITPERVPILAQCCNWIRIHIDAVSAKGYERQHQVDRSKLHKLRQNIEWLTSIEEKPEIGIGSIINYDNENELHELVKFSLKTGCNFFQAKHDLELLSEDDYRDWWTESVVPRLQDLERYYISDEFSIQYTQADYTIMPKAHRCHIHNLSTAINADSEYAYCKWLRDKPEWSAGNLKKSHMRDILNSPHHQDLCREVTPQNCGINCPYLELNDFLEELVEGHAELPKFYDCSQLHINFF